MHTYEANITKLIHLERQDLTIAEFQTDTGETLRWETSQHRKVGSMKVGDSVRFGALTTGREKLGATEISHVDWKRVPIDSLGCERSA